MALSITSSVSNQNGGSGSLTLTIPTINSGDVVIVDVGPNRGPVTSLTSPNLTYTAHKVLNYGNSTNGIERWFAIANANLSNETVTVVQTLSFFNSGTAYSVSGANTSTPFDSGGPVGTVNGVSPPPASDPETITTANANTMVIATFRSASVSQPGAGTGFTAISSLAGSFFLSEYQLLSSAQTLSCGLASGNGTGTANGSILDAIVAAGVAPNPTASIRYLGWYA